MNLFNKTKAVKTKVKAKEAEKTPAAASDSKKMSKDQEIAALEKLYYSEVQKDSEPTPVLTDGQAEQEKAWLEEENYDGQLSVDVYQVNDEIVIKSTIAGVRAEEVDVSINGDMITVRGVRPEQEEVAEEDYFYQECYWGGFSRSIILPCEVRSDRARATMEDGILTIRLPKLKRTKATTIKVKETKN